MDIRYVTDQSGKPQAVQIPIKEWKLYEKKLAQLKRKLQFLNELKKSVAEVKAIEAGKLKAKTLDELLDEL